MSLFCEIFSQAVAEKPQVDITQRVSALRKMFESAFDPTTKKVLDNA